MTPPAAFVPYIGEALKSLAPILSIASSIKSLMKSKSLTKDQAFALYLKTATDEHKKLLADPQMQHTAEAVTDSVVSTNLLNQLIEEAYACEAKHIAGRKAAAGDRTAGDRADREGDLCMCHVLQALKKFNGGHLPTDPQLDNWWSSYGC